MSSLKSLTKIPGSVVGSGSGSVSQRYGSEDPEPDPYQNVTKIRVRLWPTGDRSVHSPKSFAKPTWGWAWTQAPTRGALAPGILRGGGGGKGGRRGQPGLGPDRTRDHSHVIPQFLLFDSGLFPLCRHLCHIYKGCEPVCVGRRLFKKIVYRGPTEKMSMRQ